MAYIGGASAMAAVQPADAERLFRLALTAAPDIPGPDEPSEMARAARLLAAAGKWDEIMELPIDPGGRELAKALVSAVGAAATSARAATDRDLRSFLHRVLAVSLAGDEWLDALPALAKISAKVPASLYNWLSATRGPAGYEASEDPALES